MTQPEPIETKQLIWRKKQQAYYNENREAWNEYQKAYKKRRYSEDDEYRARMKDYAKQRRQLKKIQMDDI